MGILPKTAFWTGFVYLLTFISIPTLALYEPLHSGRSSLDPSELNAAVTGGVLEILVAMFGVVSSILLFSVFRKVNVGLAIGLLASRVIEAVTIFVGVAFLMTAVAIHRSGSGPENANMAKMLVGLYDRIFVLGQGFMPGINDLIIGVLLYRSGLLSRRFAILGMVGAFALFTGYLAIMFGFTERLSPIAGASALLVALFELLFGLLLMLKGLKGITTAA